MPKLSGSKKLALIEIKKLYEELYYDYCEEIETLFDDEDRENKYNVAEENLNRFNQLIASI